jgi:hypothetical protein
MADESTEEALQWVVLVSSDGFDFVVKRDAAIIAGTIRRMLDTNCA